MLEVLGTMTDRLVVVSLSINLFAKHSPNQKTDPSPELAIFSLSNCHFKNNRPQHEEDNPYSPERDYINRHKRKQPEPAEVNFIRLMSLTLVVVNVSDQGSDGKITRHLMGLKESRISYKLSTLMGPY